MGKARGPNKKRLTYHGIRLILSFRNVLKERIEITGKSKADSLTTPLNKVTNHLAEKGGGE